jgi:hypothetical protein
MHRHRGCPAPAVHSGPVRIARSGLLSWAFEHTARARADFALAACRRFREKYVRPGKPNDDPKSKPDHDDYDPFHLPMPTLKTGALRRWVYVLAAFDP